MMTDAAGHWMANADQAEAWNGDEGKHWVAHQERYDAMSEPFTPPLLKAASLAPTHQVLDVGCGCGYTTRAAGRLAPLGRAVGIDLSGPMLERARATAATEGLTNVIFEQGDAQVHPFPTAGVDAVISRFGIMFFADPVAAFANIVRAMRPAGRLVVLCWQELARNPWLTIPASAALARVPLPDFAAPDAPGPFSLADPDRINAVLVGAGLDQIDLTPVVAPLKLGRDAADTVDFIAGTGLARTLLATVDTSVARRALDAIAASLHPYETPAGVLLDGAAWLVTAHRPPGA
jgi:SAM-dependent methyltransferase